MDSEQVIRNLQKLSQYLMKRVDEQDKLIGELKKELSDRDDYGRLKDGNLMTKPWIGMRFGNV